MKDGHAIVADLTKEADMKRAIEEAITKMGGLDILVNRWPYCPMEFVACIIAMQISLKYFRDAVQPNQNSATVCEQRWRHER